MVLSFLGVIFGSGLARGQCESPGTCYSTAEYNAANAQKKFRVNTDSFDAYIPMLGGDVPTVVAAVMGGDVWNEQATGGHFRYMGTTTLTDIPPTYLGCVVSHPSFESIIVAFDAESDHLSYAEPKCGGYATRIKVYSKRIGGRLWRLSTGAPKEGYTDFASLIAHEFGHVQKILHPRCGENCTMAGSIASGTIRLRDLAYYDNKCSWEVSGYRAITPYFRFQDHGSFGQEQQIALGTSVSKGGAGIHYVSGGYDINAAFFTFNGGTWVPYLAGASEKPLGLFTVTSRGPTPALWREDVTMDRVFYTHYYPLGVIYSESESLGVSYVRSSDSFQTKTPGDLYRCDSMSSWMTCASSSRMTSAERISVGWDDFNNRSVTVWTNLNRANDATNGDVRVSTGYISHTTIPESDSLGVKSSVSPGVACKAYQAYGENDCIVAYVEQTDNQGLVRVKTFWNRPFQSSPPYRYKLENLLGGVVLDPNMRTASGIAAWYQNGRFYIAVRTTWFGQNLAVYSSADGYTSWSLDSSFGANTYSATAPSAASCFAGV